MCRKLNFRHPAFVHNRRIRTAGCCVQSFERFSHNTHQTLDARCRASSNETPVGPAHRARFPVSGLPNVCVAEIYLAVVAFSAARKVATTSGGDGISRQAGEYGRMGRWRGRDRYAMPLYDDKRANRSCLFSRGCLLPAVYLT